MATNPLKALMSGVVVDKKRYGSQLDGLTGGPVHPMSPIVCGHVTVVVTSRVKSRSPVYSSCAGQTSSTSFNDQGWSQHERGGVGRVPARDRAEG